MSDVRFVVLSLHRRIAIPALLKKAACAYNAAAFFRLGTFYEGASRGVRQLLVHQ